MDGEDGRGIDYIILTEQTALQNSYRMFFTDGTFYDYSLANGVDGAT